MVLRTVEGLKELTGAHFETVNARLDGIKEDVNSLAPRVEALERIVPTISTQVVALHDDLNLHKKSTADDAQFRRIHWPTFGLSAIAVASAVVSFFVH